MSLADVIKEEFGPHRPNNTTQSPCAAQHTFVTFCAGSETYYAAGLRLCRQVREGKLFGRIVCYTDQDLRADTLFWEQHGDFITTHPRGFGYWLWKPYVILKELNCGDVLYADSGCEYNPNAQDNLVAAFEKLRHQPLLCAMGYWPIVMWTKQDLLFHFDANQHDVHYATQFQAGVILLRPCPRVLSCIREWFNTCQAYNLIDDSPSIILPEHEAFVEHRHDQAIFNLCLMKHSLYGHEFPFAKDMTDHNQAIVYLRNRSGESKIRM